MPAARASTSIAKWVAALLLTAATAHAAAPGRGDARRLAEEGQAAFDRASYSEALEAFDRARALSPDPAWTLASAHCLERLGRLVEASDRYLEVARRTESGGEPSKAQLETERQADAERAALLPRIPTLTIGVEGGTSHSSVLLDGKSVGDALLGVELSVDPGTHAVEARRGDELGQELVLVTEGERRRVTIAMRTTRAAAVIVPVALAPAPQLLPSSPRERDDVLGLDRQTATWIAFGVGAAGVAVGALELSIALSKKSDLESACPHHACPPSAWNRVDGYDGARMLSTVGFAVGALGVGAGVFLLVTGPNDGVVGARGTF